jgi:hypothetical protein
VLSKATAVANGITRERREVAPIARRRRTTACNLAGMTRNRRLVSDDRGAIMIVGLFASLWLIGCLWFLIGVGNALIYREHAQQTADAIAFSSAATHARGMNFIAAINLMMVAIFAIYQVLIMTKNFLQLSLLVTGTTAGGGNGLPCGLRDVVTDPVDACGAAAEIEGTLAVVSTELRSWRSNMQVAMTGLSDVQASVAAGVPLTADLEGVRLASDAGFAGASYSPSLVPSPTEPAGAPPTNGARLGLPVESQPFTRLCEKFPSPQIQDRMLEIVAEMPSLDALRQQGQPQIRSYLTRLRNLTAADRVDRYCDAASNPFWGTAGPKRVLLSARNGSDWMGVWGFVFGPELEDRSVRKIGLASYRFDADPTRVEHHSYVAQAEMYFDCHEQWDDVTCNGGEDFAMFSLRWRARLKRTTTRAFGQDIAPDVRASLPVTLTNAPAAGAALLRKAFGQAGSAPGGGGWPLQGGARIPMTIYH